MITRTIGNRNRRDEDLQGHDDAEQQCEPNTAVCMIPNEREGRAQK